jgi:glycosyltransferase involved in cell wall biosynthesis
MATQKLKILILLDSYLPGYKGGGPTRSIKNMVDHLGDEFDFFIITADRDLGDTAPYPGVLVDQWNTVGKGQVYYASPANQSLSALARLINNSPHDVLYINSFFQPTFAIKPLLAILLGKLPRQTTIIAPRGELLDGCLKIKRWKKMCYIFLARLVGLYRGLNWQASSEFEAVTIREVMGPIAGRIRIASNLLPIPSEVEVNGNGRREDRDEPFRICFLSRLTKEKNLDYALRILKDVDIPVIFDIYGPRQDEDYWRECKALMDAQKPPVEVHYMGNLENRDVADMFRRYDLFFFPTRGENFAHVIIEAMLAGTPVLIADTTPWRNLEAEGVGWDLPLDRPQLFVETIRNAASMDSAQYAAFRQQVREYAVQVSVDYNVLDANRQLLLKFSTNS